MTGKFIPGTMVTCWDLDNFLSASETEPAETEEPEAPAEESSKSPPAEEQGQAVAVPSDEGNILYSCPVLILLNQAHPWDFQGKRPEKHCLEPAREFAKESWTGLHFPKHCHQELS